MMQEKPLQQRVSLVTGAGSGIGEAIALALAKLGSVVILCGRKQEPLRQVSSKVSGKNAGMDGGTNKVLTGESEVLVCDVTLLESVRAAADHVRRKYGKLDIL